MVSYGPTSSDLAVREPSAFSVKVWLKRPRPPVASQLTIHGEPFTSTSPKLPSNLGFVGLEAQARRNSPAARRAKHDHLGGAHSLLLHAGSERSPAAVFVAATSHPRVDFLAVGVIQRK